MEEAIAALLTHKNIDEAAKAAGVSNKTLFRWMQLPEFDRAYRDARRAAFGQATARLQQASSAAVSALLKVLVDPSSPASARVRAADCILIMRKRQLSWTTSKRGCENWRRLQKRRVCKQNEHCQTVGAM